MPRILRAIEFLAGGPVFTRRPSAPPPARRRPASDAYSAWRGTPRAFGMVLDGLREEARALRSAVLEDRGSGSSGPLWVVAA
ncbi:MAG: hypothetical protein L0216_19410 [Planctomycetales bacterium]|nr:hypothetical protein [Planctomycetales bacterium]